MNKYFSVIALSLSFMMGAYGQTFNVKDVQMGPDGQKQVAIALNNYSKKLTAFQFDLVLPEGISVAEEASLNPTRIEDHELFMAQVNDNTYRFLVFSMTNADFKGSEGDLIYIPLVSSEDVAGNTMTASIESQLVCASDGSNNDLANVSFGVQVTGEQSLAFGASGLLTCVSKFDLDFAGIDNVKAYVATGFDLAGNELWMTRVNDVPAGTPIWVKGPVDETIKVPETPAATFYPESFLQGDATAPTVISAGDENYENWILEEDGQFGKVASNMNLEAGKAYLRLPKTVATNVAVSSWSFTLQSGSQAYVGKYDLDFTDVEGLKAYTVTGFAKGGNIWLTPAKKASAGTPLYLVGEKGANYTVPSTSVQTAYVNMLKGSAVYTTDLKTLDSGLTTYILNNNSNKFVPMSPLMFSILNPLNVGTVYMPVPTDYVNNPATNRAYDTFETEAEVISIKLTERTAINRVKASRKDEGVWYNLQGQRVESPRKGLYILDGKKTVVK